MLGLAAAAACCVPAASAQKSDEPISVGYRDQVFILKPDGGARRLTRGPTAHSRPAWAPGGRRIAMSAGLSRVEVRNLSGRVLHEVRGGTSLTGQVAWSPDGGRIAFVAYNRSGDGPPTGNLVVASPDGSDRRIVATRAAERPAWSADGRTLYYLRGIGYPYSFSEKSLWSVPSSGGTARRMASAVAWSSRVLVSPDGRWVLFNRDNGLFVVRASDGGGERIVYGNPYFSGPKSYGWAFGGRAVWGGKRKGHPLVTTLDGNRRALGVHIVPSLYGWSPDRRRIAWVGGVSSGRPMRVLSARPDGTGERVVARFTSRAGTTEAEWLEWAPGGGRFALVPFRHIGD